MSAIQGTTTAVPQAAAVTTSPLAPGLPLSTDLAWHVARRLAHAATSDLVAEIRAVGVNPWLARQIAGTDIDDSACDALLAKHFTWLGATPAQLDGLTGGQPWLGSPHVARATAVRQLYSRRVLLESMVEFFGDLLYVPYTSDKSFGFVHDFDRRVIRANAMGKYRMMLRAGLTHPALLLFLDNETNEKDAVNENLGRELLELFTVGAVDPVDGTPHYTEDDVRNSSLLLTGHTRAYPAQVYEFKASRHYVGPIRVMGFSHPNDSARQGPAALMAYADYLARHPATARRVATRLCLRFVSDVPPPALVERLSATYLSKDTDIRPVLKQLFASSEFRTSIGQKLRRPAEYTAAAVMAARPELRLTKNISTYPRAALVVLMDRLQQADHYPRGWPVVNGYADVASAWSSTQAMQGRLRAAYSVAARSDPELVVASTWDVILGVRPGDNAHDAAARVVTTLTGFTPTAAHRGALAAVLMSEATPPAPSARVTADLIRQNITECVALAMSSPYFALR